MRADAAKSTDSASGSYRVARGGPCQQPFWSRRPLLKARHAQLSSRPCSTVLAAILLVLLAVTPAAAVRIPFSNCLDESYRLRDPTPLQWNPLHAEATFDVKSENHGVQVIVWGNVSGSFSDNDLPPPEDPYWTDDERTDGKIIRTADPDSETPSKATTLFRRIDILTFRPWNQIVDFCTEGLTNAACPLGPVFNTDNIETPYGLPSVNITHDMFASYSFSTFNPEFLVIYGDEDATSIGCISTSITPDLGNLSQLLRFLPLLILVLTGTAVVFAAICSPWGSTDIFHWTSNYGRDADLLRLVTPGFGDCLQYIQFVVLTGGLNVDYPGFFQPIVSKVSWSTLMFNQSFVTKSEPWQSVVDGIYVTDGKYGLERLGQLAGMAKPQDIWAGMMVWLLVIIAGVSVLIQAGFLVQWAFRTLSSTPEEDLRSKNVPFSVGNVIRIVYNYFLLPIITLSAFQLVVASRSPTFTVALAVITIVLLVGFAAWTLFLIIRTRPKSVLFDDLPIVLRYGPLYNTYSDHSAAFALIPVLLTFVRGVAIGAVQASGIAQVVVLALCEVVQVLTIHAFRPFNPTTSMNAYHTIFSTMRFLTVMLMISFAQPLDVDHGVKGWIGYVVLVLHAAVLILGFMINALQTIVEVIALMLGAGGDDDRGLTRGGLSKIFGMRQLARRAGPRNGPSRASQQSTSRMLDADDGPKTGVAMAGGRLRSESGASLGGMMGAARHRSSSALDSFDLHRGGAYHRHAESASSYLPGTPGGDTSTFSFLASPTAARGQHPGPPLEAADPYYRPPRRRQEMPTESPHPSSRQQQATGDTKRVSAAAGPATTGEAADVGPEISGGATPAPGVNPVSVLPNRPDYSTREVDFYYGVRGPALNSDGPGRKLGTGPADPTGPVATATGWFRNLLGGKTKEKGKGFEVVRSARMPPDMMARNGAGGIPVAMGVLRHGPIDSDDDDEPPLKPANKRKPGDLLTETGEPRGPGEDEPDSPVTENLPRGSQPAYLRAPSSGNDEAGAGERPEIPRKSSKRNSAMVDSSRSITPAPQQGEYDDDRYPHQVSLLPFERTGSQRQPSSHSSTGASVEFSSREDRPTSFGVVSQHNINRIDPEHGVGALFGSSAELVDERGDVAKQT